MSISIKVAHKGTNRQFRVPKDTTYAQLAEHIATLFQLSGELTLLYQDEDGDTVSVNSDLELHEAFQYAARDGKLRVALSVSGAPASPYVSRAPSIAPSVASLAPAQHSEPQPYKVAVAESVVEEHDGIDADEPMEPETHDDERKDDADDEEQADEDDEPPTKEQLTQRFLHLLQQHNDILTGHPALAAHANALADHVITEIQGEDANAPAAEEHVEAVKALESVLDVMSEFQPQVIFVRRSAGYPGRQFRGCMRGRFHPWHHQQRMHPCAGRRQCHRPEEQLPTEDEQLKTLADMGFADSERNKDYLRRYPGNLHRVIELLTRETQEEEQQQQPKDAYLY